MGLRSPRRHRRRGHPRRQQHPLPAIHVKLDGCGRQALRVTRTKILRKYGHKKGRRIFVKGMRGT